MKLHRMQILCYFCAGS